MNWDCMDTEERLSDFLDGAISAEEAAAFKGHEDGCTRCAELVTQVGGLVRRMQRTEAVEMPERLVTNILDATLGPRKTQSRFDGWFGWAQAIWQPRFAMGVLTVASSFAIVVHAAGVIPATIGWADLNPANVMRSANRQAHLTYGRAEKFVWTICSWYMRFGHSSRKRRLKKLLPLKPPGWLHQTFARANPQHKAVAARTDCTPKPKAPSGGVERSRRRCATVTCSRC